VKETDRVGDVPADFNPLSHEFSAKGAGYAPPPELIGLYAVCDERPYEHLGSHGIGDKLIDLVISDPVNGFINRVAAKTLAVVGAVADLKHPRRDPRIEPDE
jgi:hypothetical protein